MAYLISEKEVANGMEEDWVLLIDDDPALAVILGSFLERLGFRLRCAQSPAGAAKIVQAGQPSLCVVDLNLSDAIDGFTVLRALRKRYGAQMPLIVLSGDSRPTTVSKALEAGADDFLAKPPQPDELKRALGRYLPVDRQVSQTALRPTPQGGLRSALDFPSLVTAANESGLEVNSAHFVSPGTPLQVSCSLFQEAHCQERQFMTVTRCETAADGSYRVTLVLENLSTEQRCRWRHLLRELRRRSSNEKPKIA